MDKEVERRFTAIEKRLSILEDKLDLNCKEGNKILKLDLVLPEADIGGLHFNEQKVHGIFELKEDGNYYSRDILFYSARDTDEGTGRDLLSEYLASQDVKDAFIDAMTDALIGFDEIHIFLPEENQGIKKYNGVSSWYWLRRCSIGTAAIVNSDGLNADYRASAVGGCAPAFCVR